MRAKPKKQRQRSFFYPDLLDKCNPKPSLLELGKSNPWGRFGKEFAGLYGVNGRGARPASLMIGLMLLTQLENPSDERGVEAWTRNPCYRAFCGMTEYQWSQSCDPADLVYSRKGNGCGGWQDFLRFRRFFFRVGSSRRLENFPASAGKWLFQGRLN